MKSKLFALFVVVTVLLAACVKPTVSPIPTTPPPTATLEPLGEIDLGAMSFATRSGKEEFNWVITSRLDVKQDANFWGALYTDSISEYTSGSGVTINDDVTINGTITATSLVTSSASLDLSGNLAVAGSSTLSNSLTVSGTTALVGATTATGVITANGGVAGDVTGNVTGDVTGTLTGDVTGNVTGNVTGDVTGTLTGAITGPITLTGALTTTGEIAYGANSLYPLGVALPGYQIGFGSVTMTGTVTATHATGTAYVVLCTLETFSVDTAFCAAISGGNVVTATVYDITGTQAVTSVKINWLIIGMP